MKEIKKDYEQLLFNFMKRPPMKLEYDDILLLYAVLQEIRGAYKNSYYFNELFDRIQQYIVDEL